MHLGVLHSRLHGNCNISTSSLKRTLKNVFKKSTQKKHKNTSLMWHWRYVRIYDFNVFLKVWLAIHRLSRGMSKNHKFKAMKNYNVSKMKCNQHIRTKRLSMHTVCFNFYFYVTVFILQLLTSNGFAPPYLLLPPYLHQRLTEIQK